MRRLLISLGLKLVNRWTKPLYEDVVVEVIRPSGNDLQDRYWLYSLPVNLPKHGFHTAKKVN